MPQPLVYIRDVTPTIVSWSVKVMVGEKMHPRQGQHSPRQYQRLILIDQQGTRIMATLYDRDIELFRNSLQLFDTYIISKAKVAHVDLKYRIVDNKYQWIINGRTAVLRVTHDVIPRDNHVHQFVPFSEFHTYVGTKSLIDIIVVVIDKLPERSILIEGRNVVLQDFGIVDESFKPCVLTLWNNIALTGGESIVVGDDNMPIITITRVTVSTYYGLSLGSTSSSGVVVDPQIPIARRLKEWRRENRTQLKSIAVARDYIVRAGSSSSLNNIKLTTVSDLICNDNCDKFRVLVKGKIQDSSQHFFYMACDKCNSSTSVELDWEFECMRCQAKTSAKARAKLWISIFDDTGHLNVLVFGEMAENIMGMSVLQIMEMRKEADGISVLSMNEKLQQGKFNVEIKKKIYSRVDGPSLQYYINDLIEEADPVSLDDLKPSTNEDSNDVGSSSELGVKSLVARQLFGSEEELSMEKSNEEPLSDTADPNIKNK